MPASAPLPNACAGWIIPKHATLEEMVTHNLIDWESAASSTAATCNDVTKAVRGFMNGDTAAEDPAGPEFKTQKDAHLEIACEGCQ